MKHIERGGYGRIGVSFQASTDAKERQETIAEELVNHPAMSLLDHLHHHAEKLVQDLDHAAGGCGSAHGGEGANVHKHHRDNLLHPANTRIACQDCLGGLLPNVQPERPAKPFLLTKLHEHMIELADEQPKLVRPHQRYLDVKAASRHGLRRGAQVVDRLEKQSTDHQCGAESEGYPDAPDKDC